MIQVEPRYKVYHGNVASHRDRISRVLASFYRVYISLIKYILSLHLPDIINERHHYRICRPDEEKKLTRERIKAVSRYHPKHRVFESEVWNARLIRLNRQSSRALCKTRIT